MQTLVQDASMLDVSQHNDLGILTAELSINKTNTLGGGLNYNDPLQALGGEMLSQFKYEASMNQSKLLISAILGGSSHLNSTISSIMSMKSSILGSQKISL